MGLILRSQRYDRKKKRKERNVNVPLIDALTQKCNLVTVKAHWSRFLDRARFQSEVLVSRCVPTIEPLDKLADGWRIPMLRFCFFHRAQILFHLPSAQLRVIQTKQMDVFKVLYHRWTQLKTDCYLLRVAGWRRRTCRGNRFGFGPFFFSFFGWIWGGGVS